MITNIALTSLVFLVLSYMAIDTFDSKDMPRWVAGIILASFFLSMAVLVGSVISMIWAN